MKTQSETARSDDIPGITLTSAFTLRMSDICHSSVLRVIADVLRDGLRSPRRVFQQLLGRTDYQTPKRAEHFKKNKKFGANGETFPALNYACEVAKEALRHGDAQTLSMLSKPLEQLEECGAIRLAFSRKVDGGHQPNEKGMERGRTAGSPPRST